MNEGLNLNTKGEVKSEATANMELADVVQITKLMNMFQIAPEKEGMVASEFKRMAISLEQVGFSEQEVTEEIQKRLKELFPVKKQ